MSWEVGESFAGQVGSKQGLEGCVFLKTWNGRGNKIMCDIEKFNSYSSCYW